ncbi:MAG: hypothetical protein J6U19_04225 [Oscillospiraceae bacterium]|nr:hypothetical protein [Oscillospiraceae bacterium]
MAEKCIRCGSPAAYPIRALEVRTLPVRGLGGERKVQALGDEKQGGVCERCAREQLNLSLDPVRAVKPRLIRFGAVFAAGLLIEAATFLFLKDNRQVFLLLGIAALVCGVLGIYDVLNKAKEKSASLRALPEAEALEEAAWDVFVDESPKKEDVNDLTYIPVNEKTRSRKNGDLMILYHLLPEIAVEAWKRLHPENTAKGENQ